MQSGGGHKAHRRGGGGANNRASCLSKFGLLFDGLFNGPTGAAGGAGGGEDAAAAALAKQKAVTTAAAAAAAADEEEDDAVYGSEPISVGVPKETAPGERRVAVTPSAVEALRAKGVSRIYVESGAGVGSEVTDGDYEDAGAVIVSDAASAWGCDVVLHVRPPTESEAALMRGGSVLFSFVAPHDNASVMDVLTANHVTCFAMDLIPRISRAQWYDALSSMANIAGYRAVLEASHSFGRYFCRQSTAAGVSQPARVLIIGVGVAGLQAIATAKRLGCVVRCMDPRPETRGQVESLGGVFVDVPIEESGAGSGGYAKTMSAAYITAQKATIARECATADVVITTALIPGRPAPVLVTKEAVLGMKSGAVIVDLAAERGGNCELTQRDETVIIDPVGVRIIGDTNLPSKMAPQASEMYANNVVKFFAYALPKPRGRLQDRLAARLHAAPDNERADALLIASTVSHGGTSWYPVAAHHPHIMEQLWPKRAVDTASEVARKEAAAADARASAARAERWLTAASLAAAAVAFGGLFAVGAAAPAAYASVGTFGLSLLIGYHTVHTCEAALHSPFMSLTNALSGVAVVGGIMLGGGGLVPTTAATALASVSVFLSSLNLFGGFRVTSRTLTSLAPRAKGGEVVGGGAFASLPLWAYAAPAGLGCGIIASIALAGAPAASALAGVIPIGYLAAGMLAAGSLGTFRSPAAARVGTVVGGSAMALGAVAAVAELYPPASVLVQLAIAAAAGAVGGTVIAERMDGAQELPQMVALFHSSVGAAATLTSYASLLTLGGGGVAGGAAAAHGARAVGHHIASAFGLLMGGITCTGSLVAFAKLADLIPGRATSLPGRDVVNGVLAVATGACMVGMVALPTTAAVLACAGGVVAGSSLLGVHLTLGIGGADMPVVVTVLNSYSGWALVAEGFLLHNELLLICGSLIGASGAKLTAVMCHGMNRSLAAVLFGGAGTSTKKRGRADEVGEVTETSPQAVADALASASRVVIVPGYGMAQARAQQAVAEVSGALVEAGVSVTFAVHAVAGRMPGQMNCLLGEADVPYELVKEGDEVNDTFGEVDVVLVVGANDICNSDAVDDPDSELAGMPVLRVWEAKQVVVLKRSLGAGYVGVENPVFFKPNTSMLFGDAKKSCEAIATSLRQRAATVGGGGLVGVPAKASPPLVVGGGGGAAGGAAPLKV